jgi:hydrogenase-4 component B
LPKVYKAAPFSLNALSSGILTKVAAYGILRVAAIVFSVDRNSLSLADVNLWLTSANIGRVLIWLGILTMVVGVFMALIQEDVKKMLAYHSVSQMGYIVLGIGVAAYLGYKGAMGLSGSLYHMINHGLFKALLFMSAGAVYFYTKETNMYRLGGLWKKMPWVALLALIGALGITGMPGFNGFASKSILHHAIMEAYEYGDSSFRYAEWLFTLVSAGTVSSFMKFYSYIFLGKLPEKFINIKPKNKWMIRAMVVLAVMIVLIGIFPSWLMDNFLIKALLSFSYDPSFISKYIVGMNFFNAKDLQNMALVYALGAAIFYIGVKFHLFHAHLPSWMNAEKWLYNPANKFCEQFPEFCVISYEKPMIRGDVFIYVILLTLLLGGFIVSLLF